MGVHVRGYYSKEKQKFHREIAEVVEFYVTEDNEPESNVLYKKTPDGKVILRNPSKYLLGYLESQGVIMQPDILVSEQFKDSSRQVEYKVDNSYMNTSGQSINYQRPVAMHQQQVASYQQGKFIQRSTVPRMVTPMSVNNSNSFNNRQINYANQQFNNNLNNSYNQSNNISNNS